MRTETRFADSAGVRIAYEVRGEGPPLLLVHGLGYARWGWEPVADELADDFAVALFDNRGIGESDSPPGPYSAGTMAADAVAVLDAAGFERAHVLGTSLGGMIAQLIALDFPERVERLVLVCTTPGGAGAYPMPDVTVRLMEQAPLLPSEEALRRFVENALAPGTVAARPEVAERILEHRLTVRQSQAAWIAQATAGATFDVSERMGEIAAPTLVLHGSADVVVDPRNAELLARSIPDVRVELFPETGHVFFWERPERFVQVVREFLNEV